MRRVTAECSEWTASSTVHRVTAFEDAASEWEPTQRFLALVANEEERQAIVQMRRAGLTNVGWISAKNMLPGDIVVNRGAQAVVLYRETDTHHALLMTNRCNSYCLMCSQPPTRHQDGWLVEEAMEVIRHIRHAPAALGLSGGEPLLLGTGLRRVIEEIQTRFPSTRIDVLTNGRLFSDPVMARLILEGLTANVTWLVPLYGHAGFLHDFVVQTHGAFEETVDGLLALRAYEQQVQLRTVLIRPVLEILPELCVFIGRNFPFVREVALMGCEPIGFALANREHCEVDLAEWKTTLETAGRTLHRHAVPFVLMNTPLCALPRSLWPDASMSISDWKNVYAQECDHCVVKSTCPGLFSWHENGWKPTRIQPIVEISP